MEVKDLLTYFKGQKKHIAYDKTKQLYDAIKLHSSGEKPLDLLNDYRPSETDEIKNYRLKIHEPITREVITQISTSLSKIRRSSDWSVRYSDDLPKKIASDETPEKYFEKKFPYLESLNNWVFSILLNQYLIDSNAVCLVMPTELEIGSNEYFKPYPIIFNSDNVYEYEYNKIAILKSNDKAIFRKGRSLNVEGDKFYVVTTTLIQVWEQTAKSYDLVSEWNHNLGYLPCFKLRGIINCAYDKEIVWESRINSIIPRLNKVARQDSDLDAGIVTHLYPEAWEYASQPCEKCFDHNTGQSTGRVKSGEKLVGCSTCSGTGIVANSGPYKKMVIRPTNQNMGESPAPTPPKGYIEKPLEIIKIQDEIIEKNTYKALSAINMQFLVQTPANQSGYAKDVDRDELNNFVYSIAEDLIWVMDKVYKIGIDIRYAFVADEKQREEMRPKVAVPEKYDILSLNFLMEELAIAVEKKLPPSILNSMMIEFANKKFYNEPEIKEDLTLSLRLDPMPCISIDEKATIRMNNGVSEIDYIISCNLVRFLTIAKEQNKEFSDLTYTQQMDILTKIATEYKKKNEPSVAIIADINGENGGVGVAGNALANSVGGLTGMIEIVKAVASGVYDLDAAVSLVAQRFQISEEEARKQLGTPQVIEGQQDATIVQKLT